MLIEENGLSDSARVLFCMNLPRATLKLFPMRFENLFHRHKWKTYLWGFHIDPYTLAAAQLPCCRCLSSGAVRIDVRASLSLSVFMFPGYICSAKLVPVSQYLGTVLVCLLGVACLRGEALHSSQAGGQWLIFEIKVNVKQCRFVKTIFHQGCFSWGWGVSHQGYGRWKNSEYLQFITILDETKKNHTPENKVWQPSIIFSWDVWSMVFKYHRRYLSLCAVSA